MIGCDNSNSDDKERLDSQISSYVQNNDEVAKDINSSRAIQFPNHEELEEMDEHGLENMAAQGWRQIRIPIPPIDPNDYPKFEAYQVDSPPGYEFDRSIFGKILESRFGAYENGVWREINEPVLPRDIQEPNDIFLPQISPFGPASNTIFYGWEFDIEKPWFCGDINRKYFPVNMRYVRSDGTEVSSNDLWVFSTEDHGNYFTARSEGFFPTWQDGIQGHYYNQGYVDINYNEGNDVRFIRVLKDHGSGNWSIRSSGR